jgi:hypothetical protein
VYVHVYIYMCKYQYLYVHKYVQTSVYILKAFNPFDVCLYVRMYLCVYTCMNVYMQIYTYPAVTKWSTVHWKSREESIYSDAPCLLVVLMLGEYSISWLLDIYNIQSYKENKKTHSCKIAPFGKFLVSLTHT